MARVPPQRCRRSGARVPRGPARRRSSPAARPGSVPRRRARAPQASAASRPQVSHPSRSCSSAWSTTSGSCEATTTAAPHSRASRESSAATDERVRLVEPRRRLVGDQDVGPRSERAGDRDAQALAAGEPLDALLCALGEPDGLERGSAPSGDRPCRRSPSSTFSRAPEERDELGLLRDVADVLATKGGASGSVERRHVGAEQVDGAVVRELEPGDDVEQGRLAGARRPGHRSERAAVERRSRVRRARRGRRSASSRRGRRRSVRERMRRRGACSTVGSSPFGRSR